MAVRTQVQEFIRGLHNLRTEHHGNVVTIGSFDGVHLGHQAVLRQLCQQAAQLSMPSMVMIFEPQPHEFFAGDRAPARLMRLREKVLALFSHGVDRICCLPFNNFLSQLSAEDFIDRVLLQGLGVKYLVIGDDFRFGSGREGDYRLLQMAGDAHNFIVTDTDSYLVGGQRVSSTRIRQLLQENAFVKAAKLLGKPYKISGRVVKGKQLGRKLGTPTANVHLHRYRSPLSGVFAVEVELPIGEVTQGVANVGIRPTISGDDKPILEVHLFNRDGNLYGQEISVEFKHKIREEQRFSGLDELKQHIQQDIDQAKQFFTQNT